MLKVMAVLMVLVVCLNPIGLLIDDEPYLLTCSTGGTDQPTIFHVKGEISFPRRFKVSFFSDRKPALEKIVAFDELIEKPDRSISSNEILDLVRARVKPTDGRWVFNWKTVPYILFALLIATGLVWWAFFRKKKAPTAI